MSSPTLTPEGLVDLVRDQRFKDLSPDDREDMFNRGVADSRAWVSREGGGWNSELWKGYNTMVDELREEALGKSVGEHIWSGAKTIGQVAKDSAAIAGTAVASSIIKDNREPVSPFFKELAQNVAKLPSAINRGAKDILLGSTKLVDTDLDLIKKDIDEGNIPFDGHALKDWVQSKSDAIEERQNAYYKLVEGDSEDNKTWAKANSLTGNAENLGLLTGYLQTRDPKLWSALRSQLLKPVKVHETEVSQKDRVQNSHLGKVMDWIGGEGTSNYIIEAGDPFELAGTALSALKGAKAIATIAKGGSKVATAAKAIGNAVIGAGGETLSEMGSHFVDDPTATWEQRREVAKEAFIGSLGLVGIGAATQAVTSRVKATPETTLEDTFAAPATPETVAPATTVQPATAAPVTPIAPEVVASNFRQTSLESAAPVQPIVPVQGIEEHISDLTLDDVADLDAAIDVELPNIATIAPAASTDLYATPNTNDPSLSSQLQPGILNQDVSPTPDFTDAEAADRVRQWEPTLTNSGQLVPGQRLAAATADSLSGRADRANSLAFAKAFSGLFGRRVVVVDGLKNNQVGGATHPALKDTVFLNAQSERNWHSLAGHEMVHHLEVAHPDLFSRLDKVLTPGLQRNESLQKQYKAYAVKGEGLFKDPAKNVRREAYADLMADSISDPHFWDTMSQREPGLFLPLARSVWQWFRGVIDGLTKRGWASSQYFQDVQAAQARLAEAMVEFARREQGMSPQDATAAIQGLLSGDNFFEGKVLVEGPNVGRQTRSRFARPEESDRYYETRADTSVRAMAEAWLDARSMETALNELSGVEPPAGMTNDVWQQAIGQLVMRANTAMTQGDEFQRAQSRILANKAARLYQDSGREAARGLRQRANVNHELVPIAPVLAAEKLLIDRAEAVVSNRFEGGTEGAAKRTEESGKKAGSEAGNTVSGQVEGATAPTEQEAIDDYNKATQTAEKLISQIAERHSDTPTNKRPKGILDPIRGLYEDHLNEPMSERDFVNVAAAFGVPRPIASSLWNVANLEIRARAAYKAAKDYEAARKPTDALLAKDSPQLAKLLTQLRSKMYPGMSWKEIFEELPSQQRERQREIYTRLRKDTRLQRLTKSEILSLTNELDKAWQRERRKVFTRELQKVGAMGEKLPRDLAKVQKAIPKLLRAINLGLMTSETFREAVAPEYGLKQISQADAQKLRQQAEEAYQLPEGILRNRKLANLLSSLQKTTGTSRAEMLNQYWVAAVLSGMRTMFDTFASSLNGFGTNLVQSSMLMGRGNRQAAVQAHMEWWKGLQDGVRESVQILTKGDYSYLKRFNEDLRKALDGESTFRPVPLGEALWKDGNWWQKWGLAPTMMWTGRLMAAADHINNTATTRGALAVARALHPELYQGTNTFTAHEQNLARYQATVEVMGVSGLPASKADSATITKRTREILYNGIASEVYEEAAFIGDRAAYQNDPIGILGGVYRTLSGALGNAERMIQKSADEIHTDGPAGEYARASMLFLSGALRSAMGAKFIRFGANFGNDMMGFIPGTYLLSRAGQSMGMIERTRSQNDLLLGSNIVGFMAASTVGTLLLGKSDDEEGLHIEGSWSGLTPEQKNQRKAAGFEPWTFWWRGKDKVSKLSYRSWPLAGVFTAVGAAQDEQRFKPEKFTQRGFAGHLLHAACAGALQVKDSNSIKILADLFGASAMGADPEADLQNKLVKIPTGFAGGFVPTLIKDLDAFTDPRSYKPEGVFEEFSRNVPILRSNTSGRPQVNILGEDVELNRLPWSRAYTSQDTQEAHRVLGLLLSRGLNLPPASDRKTVVKDGIKVPISALGPDAVYKYQRMVGQGYATWLNAEGQSLLSMPVEQAERVISRQANYIRANAAIQISQ